MVKFNPKRLLAGLGSIYQEFSHKLLLLKKKQNDIVNDYMRELDREKVKQIRKNLGRNEQFS